MPFTLEVGAITEEIVVRAETPLLDTNSLSSGANFDSRLVDSLPMFSNMPITLSRFSPGVNVNDAQTQVSQGYVDNTSLSAGSLLGLPLAGTQNPLTPPVGGNNYTLDGANNNGSNRRIAASPNSDMIQEMRVESANFDASVGHGLGLQISMMTRAGTNTQRGTVNYQYWSNKLNALTEQQKIDLRRPREERVREGALAQPVADRRRPGADSRHRGRPRQAVLLRQLLAAPTTRSPARSRGRSPIPANEKHLQGDFSDLLRLPNPAQYQIYDPLTTRPDPTNPSRMIRDPFPNNIIPRDRIFNPDGTYKNPLMALYSQHGPEAEPELRRERPAADQQLLPRRRARLAEEPAVRLPARLQRLVEGSLLLPHQRHHVPRVRERLDLPAPDPALRIHSADRSRYQWSYTGTWTRAMGTTVLDSSFATNRFNQIDEFRGLKQYKPTDVGLPSYLDEFCSTQGRLHAAASIGHRRLSGLRRRLVATAIPRRTCRAQSTITSVKGRHTLHGGVDVRRAQRDRTGGGNRSGQLNFDRTYTRQFSDESDADAEQPRAVAGRVRAGPADVGVDQRHVAVELQQLLDGRVRAGHLASGPVHPQRRSSLRIRDRRPREGRPDDRRLRPDGQARDHRRRAGGLPGQRPAEPAGHAGDAHRARRADLRQRRRAVRRRLRGEAMWMPRVSASYLLGDRTVLKGGYGLYYDTLNAADYVAAQAGYSVTTTSTISDDLGRTFKWATPATGASELRSVPGARRRHALGPGGRRRARRQLAAGRHPHHGERPARARPPAALARVAPAGARRRISASKSPTPAPTTTSSR